MTSMYIRIIILLIGLLHNNDNTQNLLRKNNSIKIKFSSFDTIKQSELYHLGKSFKKNKKYKESLKYFNKVLKINPSNKTAIKTYFQISFSFIKLNDNIKAISTLKNLERILKEKGNNNNNNNNNKLLIKTYINLSYLYLNLDNQKESNTLGLFFCEKADSLINFTKVSTKTKFKIKLNLASFYNQFDHLNIEKANFHYNQALKIAVKTKDTLNVFNVLLSLGNLYNTISYKKSINYIEKSKIYLKKTDSFNQFRVNYNYSEIFANFNYYKKSIQANIKSIEYLTNLESPNFFTKKNVFFIENKIHLSYSLNHLAESNLKYFQLNNDSIFLKKSIKYFKLTDYIIDLLKINNSEFKSKLYWREKSTNIYGKAMKACFLDNNLKDAFYFMEKNKALLLMEDIATENYKLSLEVPSHLLAKETQYKKQLILLENIKVKNKDSILKVKIDLERVLLTFQDSIYNDKPRLANDLKISTIKDVQKSIKKNEVFIEYHISIDDGYGIYSNNENGYVFFITKDKVSFFEISNLSKLKEQITLLISLTKTPFKTNKDKIDFNNLSFTIFNKLFPTKEIKNLIKNKKITISPDSYLSLLAFETLITKNNHLEKSNYLIKSAEISYLYSHSFLNNTKTKITKSTSFLGFAPIHFKNLHLKTLVNTQQEIKNSINFYSGKIFINAKATKNNFLEELPKHNIIHLATHANAQDSINPWIAFYDQKITLPELYLTKNKASLVVLSGCNTTLGKQEIGEGVMSLARGFFYGGSQSVVSSLWSVDDKSTTYIMNQFYKNLYNGQTKSLALHNAKLNYLDNHSLSELSPHYWASFILLGKDDVVLHSNYNSNWYVVYLVVVLVIVFFVSRRYRRFSRNVV